MTASASATTAAASLGNTYDYCFRAAVDLCLGYRVQVSEYLYPDRLFNSIFHRRQTEVANV